MALHTLSSFRDSRKNKKRVGRGHGSGRGTTATRGTKGQRARSGVSGLKLRGLRQTMLRIPKLRGFKSLATKPGVINLAKLNELFNDGDTVTPAVLIDRKILKSENSSAPLIKVLGTGTLSKKLTIEGCTVSVSAKAKIEKAGGRVA